MTRSEVDKVSKVTPRIEPRTVVALETGATGIVTDVRTDGILVIALHRGQWVERGPAVTLEVLAGPDEPHDARHRILDDWLQRPADWPEPWDATTSALTRALWTTARAFMAEHGLVQGRDVHIDLSVTRPRLRVPSALKLRRDELLVPFEPTTQDPEQRP